MAELTYCDESELEAGGFIEAPCWLHCTVDRCDPYPVNKNGESLDGVRLTVTGCRGCDLSKKEVKGLKGKMFNELFFNPNDSSSDNGEFASKRQMKLLLALGLLPKLKPGQKFEPDWEAAAGRQLVIKIKAGKKSGELTGFHEIDGLHMYSVDHEAVADVPKDPKVMELLKGKKGGTGKGGPPPQKKSNHQPADPTADGADEDDFDDV